MHTCVHQAANCLVDSAMARQWCASGEDWADNPDPIMATPFTRAGMARVKVAFILNIQLARR